MEISVDDMYKIENKGHDMGFLKKFMMENAGAAATRRLIEKFGDVEGKNIPILVGKGNNGGDGLVMARHLVGYGAKVYVCLVYAGGQRGLSDEHEWNLSLCNKMSKSLGSLNHYDQPNQFKDESEKYVGMRDYMIKPDILIDALLGTGISGEIREPYASAINYFNRTDCFKFAVDVPSGLDPQTGETANIYTKCDMTVTFHKMKQGIPKRKDLTGELFVEKIGIPPEAEEGIL